MIITDPFADLHGINSYTNEEIDKLVINFNRIFKELNENPNRNSDAELRAAVGVYEHCIIPLFAGLKEFRIKINKTSSKKELEIIYSKYMEEIGRIIQSKVHEQLFHPQFETLISDAFFYWKECLKQDVPKLEKKGITVWDTWEDTINNLEKAATIMEKPAALKKQQENQRREQEKKKLEIKKQAPQVDPVKLKEGVIVFLDAKWQEGCKRLGGGNFGDVYELKVTDANLLEFLTNQSMTGRKDEDGTYFAVKTIKSKEELQRKKKPLKTVIDETNNEIAVNDTLRKEWLALEQPKGEGEVPIVLSIGAKVVGEQAPVIICSYAAYGDATKYLKRSCQNIAKKGDPIKVAINFHNALLRGLDLTHKAGYLHRDVAARNLLVTQTNKGIVAAKLADFGLAIKAGISDEKAIELGIDKETAKHIALLSPILPIKWTPPSAIRNGYSDRYTDLYSAQVALLEDLALLGGLEEREIFGDINHKEYFRLCGYDPIAYEERRVLVRISDGFTDQEMLDHLKLQLIQALPASPIRTALEDERSEINQSLKVHKANESISLYSELKNLAQSDIPDHKKQAFVLPYIDNLWLQMATMHAGNEVNLEVAAQTISIKNGQIQFSSTNQAQNIDSDQNATVNFKNTDRIRFGWLPLSEVCSGELTRAADLYGVKITILEIIAKAAGVAPPFKASELTNKYLQFIRTKNDYSQKELQEITNKIFNDIKENLRIKLGGEARNPWTILLKTYDEFLSVDFTKTPAEQLEKSEKDLKLAAELTLALPLPPRPETQVSPPRKPLPTPPMSGSLSSSSLEKSKTPPPVPPKTGRGQLSSSSTQISTGSNPVRPVSSTAPKRPLPTTPQTTGTLSSANQELFHHNKKPLINQLRGSKDKDDESEGDSRQPPTLPPPRGK